MTDFLLGVQSLLVSAGVGSGTPSADWGVHYGTLPTTPDRVIVIRSSGGMEPNPKWLLDYPSLQVIVRGGVNDYITGRAKAQAVKDTLLGLDSQDINGDRWDSITMVGDVTDAGRDENNRPLTTANFKFIIEPASGANRLPL